MAASTHNPSSISSSCLKLQYLNRVKLFPLSLSNLTFSTLLSLVSEAFPETHHGETPSSTHVELFYSDEDGDAVVVDDEDSFALASLSFQEALLDVIEFQIHVRDANVRSSNPLDDGSSARTPAATAPASYNRQPRIPCRHFQTGSCRYGSNCRFLHNVTHFNKSTKPSTSLSDDESDNETCLTSLKSSEYDKVSDLLSPDGASSSNYLRGSSVSARSARSPASYNRQPHIPCRYFQAGFCRHGSSCTFLHNATKLSTLMKANSLSDDSEIEAWLDTLKSASENDTIAYLASPVGYDSFVRVLNYPHLPELAVNRLVGLLTRRILRTSMLRRAAAIYNALIGTKFLKALHSHICTAVKPILFCIEPYVFLCEELIMRTSSGWKEVPLNELKALLDEVKSGSITELSHILAGLLDFRAEKQRLGAVEEVLDAVSLNHLDRETRVKDASNFNRTPDEGSDEPCEQRLSCGHACPQHCHPGSHVEAVCPKRCLRKLPLCDHHCQSLCHGFSDCPPCCEPIPKQLPLCGHSNDVCCSTAIESVICEAPCPKVLKCSHSCQATCGVTCTPKCLELVERVLPCGHLTKIACHMNPLTYLCPHPCKQNLPDCQHICQGTCGLCKQGQSHVPCQLKCNRSQPC